jgi:phosphatidylinositol alpha-1,6-mannosyltransferase
MTAPGSHKQANRIIGLFPELLGVGGIQEAGRLTAMALHEIAANHEWRVDFLSLNDPPGPHSLGGRERAIPLRGFGRAKVHFALAGLRRSVSFGEGSALIILAAHPNLAVPAGWMRRVSPRARVVVMAHGVEVWKPLPTLRRRALLKADLVLGPSRDTVEKLVNVQGVSRERTRRLAWPLSPPFLRMAREPAALPLLPSFPNGRTILTVGRWAATERYKGVDALIGAIPRLRAEVPNLHMVAVGGGDDLPRLRQIAANLGVADCVHFLENLSREEVAACYARADLFALPSTGEGFGLVFLEAMAFAKPVVGAACGGTIDVVEDGVNGLLIEPGDAGALAQALGQLLRDDQLRTQLGHRGSEFVRKNFRFDLFQAELEGILASCSIPARA